MDLAKYLSICLSFRIWVIRSTWVLGPIRQTLRKMDMFLKLCGAAFSWGFFFHISPSHFHLPDWLTTFRNSKLCVFKLGRLPSWRRGYFLLEEKHTSVWLPNLWQLCTNTEIYPGARGKKEINYKPQETALLKGILEQAYHPSCSLCCIFCSLCDMQQWASPLGIKLVDSLVWLCLNLTTSIPGSRQSHYRRCWI